MYYIHNFVQFLLAVNLTILCFPILFAMIAHVNFSGLCNGLCFTWFLVTTTAKSSVMLPPLQVELSTVISFTIMENCAIVK